MFDFPLIYNKLHTQMSWLELSLRSITKLNKIAATCAVLFLGFALLSTPFVSFKDGIEDECYVTNVFTRHPINDDHIVHYTLYFHKGIKASQFEDRLPDQYTARLREEMLKKEGSMHCCVKDVIQPGKCEYAMTTIGHISVAGAAISIIVLAFNTIWLICLLLYSKGDKIIC
jgi:hypothetical protein